MVDITEQKRIETALVTQAEDLRLQAALIENAHDAIIVRDADARITFWNTGAERLYGWTQVEVLGRNVHELLGTGPERAGRDRDGAAIRARVAGRLSHRRKDGSTVVVDSRHVLVEQDDPPGASSRSTATSRIASAPRNSAPR